MYYVDKWDEAITHLHCAKAFQRPTTRKEHYEEKKTNGIAKKTNEITSSVRENLEDKEQYRLI